MALTACPECDAPLAESTGKAVDDGEVYHEFECVNCDHQWQKPI